MFFYLLVPVNICIFNIHSKKHCCLKGFGTDTIIIIESVVGSALFTLSYSNCAIKLLVDNGNRFVKIVVLMDDDDDDDDIDDDDERLLLHSSNDF